MGNKTVDQCIETILKSIEQRRSVDYGNRLSVRRFNAAYDKILENARYIDSHYPSQIDAIMKLLYHHDVDVISHCAPIILTLCNSTIEQKREAINVIKLLLTSDKLSKGDKLGFSMSLESWEKRLVKMTQEKSNGRIW